MEILPGAEDGSTPGLEGLCHISELHIERVRNCQGFVNGMNTESLEVKYLGLNARGQLQLSRKAAMVDAGKGQGGGGGGGARGGRGLAAAMTSISSLLIASSSFPSPPSPPMYNLY